MFLAMYGMQRGAKATQAVLSSPMTEKHLNMLCGHELPSECITMGTLTYHFSQTFGYTCLDFLESGIEIIPEPLCKTNVSHV